MAEKKRAFFYKIDVVDLMDFATEPEGAGMTLLQFAKELNRGESSIPYIQKVINEAHGYMAKKSEDSRKAGIASALSRQQKSTAVEQPLTGVEQTPTESNGTQPISSSSNKSSTKEEKVKYLDFVFLTETENRKLIERFGESEADALKERLNNYVGSKGKKYKSHYFTMLNWKNKDAPKIAPPQQTPELYQRDPRILATLKKHGAYDGQN